MRSLFNRTKSLIDRIRIQKITTLKLQNPVITFSFDDVPETAFNVARKILMDYNYRGTYYVSLGLMDRDSALGKMFSLSSIEAAFAEGHELGCHTYSHINSFKVSLKKVSESIEKNQREIEKIFPGFRFANFSYPFGEVTAGLKKIVNEKFLSGRTSYIGLNHGIVDLNALKATAMDSNSMDLKAVQKLINRSRELKAWIIFYTHDVRENCSPFGCKPKFFEDVVKLCQQNNLEVLTVNQTLQKYVLKEHQA